MADALVSIALETLKKILTDEVVLQSGLTKDLKRLSSAFSTIQAVLEDAEERQFVENSVMDWICKLKDVAYDINDLLDENKVPKSLSRYFCFNQILGSHRLGTQIKEIKERLLDIANERNSYHFREGSRMAEILDRQTLSLVDESEIFGRDEDKNILVTELFRNCNEHLGHVPVISIVGMGGLGKTTLAQLVYNDKRVERHFEKRLWVCVSQDLNVKRVIKTLFESLSGQRADVDELENLQLRLKEMIKGKRFLLVLDDVWNQDRRKWELLRIILKGGARGSKIVVTTRNEQVSVLMNAVYLHSLRVLSPEECWSLFISRAFIGKKIEECLKFEGIGREIVEKCKGVPLGLKTLGSALQAKKTIREWEHLLESETWAFETEILPALLLSYYNLPSPLKQCFAYCSVFPKGTIILKDRVIGMWMSQGFISYDGRRDMEEVGGEMFDDLFMRSFFQEEKMYNVTYFSMHDLIHDLSQYIAKGECSIIDKKTPKIHTTKARHFTFISDEAFPLTMNNAEKVRTLRLTDMLEVDNLLSSLFIRLRYIRTLSLMIEIETLPSSIKNLRHLRYLMLSSTKIKELPESLSKIDALHALILYCPSLYKLPSGIVKIIGLRHLDLRGTTNLLNFPRGFGSLTSLRTLSYFIVGGDKGCKIEDLKELDLLRGDLTIYHLERLASGEETSAAKLTNKQHLRSLELIWSFDGNKEVEKRMEGVLVGLQPHKNLVDLMIKGYLGSRFPNWVEDPIFCNLVTLRLIDCNKCGQLPNLGKLPSLKYLEIARMCNVRTIGEEFYLVIGAFPKLEQLVFWSMRNLVQWRLTSEGEVMPSLRELNILDCPKLNSLPVLPNLLQLKIEECPVLTRRFQIGGEDWDKISHIPVILIDKKQVQL